MRGKKSSVKSTKKKSFKKRSSKKFRPSPTQSATLYIPGTQKVGNDQSLWTIVTNKNGVNRWQKV